jgi:hypothetical protein
MPNLAIEDATSLEKIASLSTQPASTGAQLGEGNPGDEWRVTQVANHPSGATQSLVVGFHVGSPHTYDPQSSGAIVSINGQIDYQTRSDAQMGGGQALWAVAVRQNGTVYRGMGSIATGSPSAVWATHQQLVLTSTEFADVTGAPGNPDFSENGSTIEFGFVTANASGVGGPGRNTEVSYDNWSVTLATQSSVPALNPIGFGLLAVLMAAAGMSSVGRL